jgi:hypothetical protein
MKRVLLIACQSQTGQLARVVESVAGPLRDDSAITLDCVTLASVNAYPFPWPFIRFFNTFPETVHERPIPLRPLAIPEDRCYDLVILAYQVWFLSPPPVLSAFLAGSDAARILGGNCPVITIIACRNMWLMAQEAVKKHLAARGARLIDNVVLVDQAHSAATFISTPLWMLTGRRGPFFGGLVPAAGIPDSAIAAARRFGQAIRAALPTLDRSAPKPMLTGLGAVTINDRLIASEVIAKRSFRIWGRLLMAIGGPASVLRRVAVCFYICFLLTMILTVVPVSALLKRFVGIFSGARVARQRAYFAEPSGEDRSRMKGFPDG